MTNLYIHVGLGKTGSTYIQNVIYSNQRLLEEYNISYPHDSSVADSGNGHLLLQSNLLQSFINSSSPSGKILFSREHLARELSDPFTAANLDLSLKSISIDQVYVLLFVRNAFDHCYSLWSQKVKNTNESRSFHRYARSYDSLAIATSFLRNALSLGWNIKVVNYSAMTSSLESVFFSWLDPFFPVQQLSIPAQSVNVSPSFRSISHKRLVNKFHSYSISPACLKYLIALFLVFCSKPSFNLFYKQLWSQQVNRFNALLSSDDCLKHSLNAHILFEAVS